MSEAEKRIRALEIKIAVVERQLRAAGWCTCGGLATTYTTRYARGIKFQYKKCNKCGGTYKDVLVD